MQENCAFCNWLTVWEKLLQQSWMKNWRKNQSLTYQWRMTCKGMVDIHGEYVQDPPRKRKTRYKNTLPVTVSRRRRMVMHKTKQATLKRNSQEDVPVTSGKESQSENTTGASARTETLNVFRKKETSPQPPVRKQSALQLWLADSEESVKSQYPEASEKELLAKAALMFKDLDNDTKQKYKSQAAGASSQSTPQAATPVSESTPQAATPVSESTPQAATPVDDDKKRKREEVIEESPVEKKPKGSGLKKLAAFVFSKES
ncbi:hypothetical protein OTU49_007804 [Cherax quadricarinatus]|uniref:HMG box domain-containing protein n=1 Tax=Cherax quadricarinatus TaxID=27406 RepID=A0AAW0WUF1_CHEQU